jgi:hypothetical protein
VDRTENNPGAPDHLGVGRRCEHGRAGGRVEVVEVLGPAGVVGGGEQADPRLDAVEPGGVEAAQAGHDLIDAGAGNQVA